MIPPSACQTTAQATTAEAGSIDVIAAVEAIVSARWPFLRDRLQADPGDHVCVPLEQLQTPGQIERQLEVFQHGHPGQDARALASLWVQWYLVTAWPPLTAAALVLGAEPALEPERTALVLDAEAKPAGLVLPPQATTGDPDAALERLTRVQAAPLLDGAARAVNMAPRVVWSNAANVLGWFLEQLQPITTPGALAPGRALLARRRWPDGTPNPLYVADAHTGSERPQRRVCCLRYRLDSHAYCSDCPISCSRRTARG